MSPMEPDILARLEAAAAGSEELDLGIAVALGLVARTHLYGWLRCRRTGSLVKPGAVGRFTRCLDDALSLVPADRRVPLLHRVTADPGASPADLPRLVCLALLKEAAAEPAR